MNWRRSARCDTGQCVEVAPGPVVRMRDSKDPGGPVLAFGLRAWAAFTAAVRAGEFDRR